MAWLLFIDESGHDRKASPYEVLAGVAVHDRDLSNLIAALHTAERQHFGRRYSAGNGELKGTKILKNKVFQHARMGVTVNDDDIPGLAKAALDDGPSARAHHLKGLALAKLRYVADLFDLCARFQCRAFASIVETDVQATASDGLRKDYAYLFERFFYFLRDSDTQEQGMLILDEVEKSQSHILIDQTQRYFRETATGKHRASLIIPEPFFVHSDLTTGIQIASLIAYCISWGFRTPRIIKPARAELSGYAAQIAKLRHKAHSPRPGNPDFHVWSFAHITDLRTGREKQESGQ